MKKRQVSTEVEEEEYKRMVEIRDEAAEKSIWYTNNKVIGIELDGIKMTLKDLDEIVISRLKDIINTEFDSDKYKKIDKLLNESKKKYQRLKEIT